jgi:hypothetical protein
MPGVSEVFRVVTVASSNLKFGRSYIMLIASVDNGPLDIVIKPPITLEFDITRNTLSSTNVGKFQLYNLSTTHRNQLRFNASDYSKFRKIQLFAGYGQNLPVVFTGNITQASSYRRGVDFITDIECFDGGYAYANGQTSLQFAKGTPIKKVIASIIEQSSDPNNPNSGLPKISVGSIGFYSDVLTRYNSFNGNTAKILDEITGGGFFIDNGKANALQTNEYIQTGAGLVTINAASGLLGTPRLEKSIARTEMLFEPALEVGATALVTSVSTELDFNGLYKIIGLKHRGVISGAVCGEATTTASFFYDKALTPVPAQIGS